MVMRSQLFSFKLGSHSLWLSGITIAIVIISSLSTATLAQAQVKTKLNIKFPKITTVGAPPRTTGTGARKTPCGFKNFDNKQLFTDQDDSSISLTGLTPENNVVTTVAPNPSIYVYIPKTVKKFVEFRIVDIADETVIYETMFPLSNNAGIIKVSTPNTVNLKPGNKYQWQFLVMCDPQDREADEMLEGWIQRTILTPEQKKRIDRSLPKSWEQAQIYAEYGVWYESMNILADLRDRNSLGKKLWTELLTSVKLEEIAQSPLIDCCSISSSRLNPSSKNHHSMSIITK